MNHIAKSTCTFLLIGVMKNDGIKYTVILGNNEKSFFLNASQQFYKVRYGLFSALVSDNQPLNLLHLQVAAVGGMWDPG